MRRLAVANDNEVHVYRVMSDQDVARGTVPQLLLEHTHKVEPGNCIHAILFTDESSSRNLAVSQGTNAGRRQGVLIWNCDMPSSWWIPSSTNLPNPIIWDKKKHLACVLQGHSGPVKCIGVGSNFVVTADTLGECRVWQKTMYLKKGQAKLHEGGVADLAVDKAFVYSIGCCGYHVSVWSLPELALLLSIPIEIPDKYLDDIPESVLPRSHRLERLTQLKRPLSRWVGVSSAKDVTSGSDRPTGAIYVAAVAAEGLLSAYPRAGLIMEWSLGVEPECRSVTIAHESPVVQLKYGPYDNGPLVTADSSGIIRVWDCIPSIHCSQELVSEHEAAPEVSIAVDPRVGLYTTLGTSKLSIWKQIAHTESES